MAPTVLWIRVTSIIRYNEELKECELNLSIIICIQLFVGERKGEPAWNMQNGLAISVFRSFKTWFGKNWSQWLQQITTLTLLLLENYSDFFTTSVNGSGANTSASWKKRLKLNIDSTPSGKLLKLRILSKNYSVYDSKAFEENDSRTPATIPLHLKVWLQFQI